VTLRVTILSREYFFVALLCLIAAVRVFVFSAAFPFFNNVDEDSHFDLVWKYSKGKLPQKENTLRDLEFLELQALFGSPEYLKKPHQFRSGTIPPPLWSAPKEVRSRTVEWFKGKNRVNREEYSEPLYYAIAGAWLATGRALGLTGGGLLYWTRFLNVPVFVLVIIIAWRTGVMCFPEDVNQRLGVPLMVSFLPQDILYAINSDVFSPLFSGIAFYFLVRLLNQRVHWIYFFAAGASLAAAILVKVTNIPLLCSLGIALFFYVKRNKLTSGRMLKIALLAMALVGPLAGWYFWKIVTVGEFAAATHKMADLSITYKPLSEVFDHPVFGLSGFWYFFHNLLASFWRGEFVWGLERLAHPAADYVYSVSSMVLIGIATIHGLRSRNDTMQRDVLLMSAGTVVSAIVLMGVLSIIFDFGSCHYPSRANPYFVSGRLILCAVIPFFTLYVNGVSVLLSRVFPSIKPIAVFSVIGLTITGVELWTRWPVFCSPYNFFHIPLANL
jgi:hypothetical protein